MEINNLYKEIYDQLKLIQEKESSFKYDIIKMSSARITGKTYTALLFSILLGTLKKTHIYAIRLVKSEIKKTLLVEAEKIFKTLKIKFITYGTSLEIKFGKGSKITFLGLKTTRKEKMAITGLGGNELYKYGSIIKDEIGEWTEQENNEVDEAIRGFKKKRVIEWWTNNPMKEGNWFSSQFWNVIRKKYPNFEELQNKNNFIKIFEKGKLFNTLYITSTYRVNKWADERVVNKLKWQLEFDPQRAKTTALGLPGVESSGIYTLLVKRIGGKFINELNINVVPNEKIIKYAVGIDYGWIDKTVFVLILITTQRFVIVDIFIYDRKKDPIITDLKLAIIGSNKIIFWNEKYKIKYLHVKYDYSNHTFAQLVENYLELKVSVSRLFVQRANKQKIELRVQIINSLFAIGKIFYIHDNYENINKLFMEFRNATWKPQTTENIRKDGNDDCINAFEYALSGQDEWALIRDFFNKAKKIIYND